MKKANIIRVLKAFDRVKERNRRWYTWSYDGLADEIVKEMERER